jgi:hypothetical protein
LIDAPKCSAPAILLPRHGILLPNVASRLTPELSKVSPLAFFQLSVRE